jgi:hypothetical protein
MDVRDIDTIVLTHEDNVEKELRGNVLAAAYKEFGYSADSFDAFGPLAKALVKCEISPLNPVQVEKYKASKTYSFRIQTWPLFILSLIGAVTTYWLMATPYLDKHGPNDGTGVLIILGGVLGTIGAVLCAAVFTGECPIYMRSRDWSRYSLGKNGDYREQLYSRYIPVHILNMAVQIKKNLPDAKLYVDELTTMSKVNWPEPDPFISVEYGSEKYYFGVWDEREFEAKA